MRPRAILQAVLLLALVVSTTGCYRGCKSSRPPIHPNPNMDDQPKYTAQTESRFFYDGSTMRAPVPGTIAQEASLDAPSFDTGMNADGSFLTSNPLAIDKTVLARGERQYTIYCLPCHDKRGLGTGILFKYGSVPTASLHDEQRMAYPDGQYFDVITNGFGLMQGYKYPIGPEDRWAIVGYIRKLQQDRVSSQMARAGTP